jgi:hypothetical protein
MTWRERRAERKRRKREDREYMAWLHAKRAKVFADADVRLRAKFEQERGPR